MVGNSKLFSFIFLTVKASANNPKSKNFLPTLLAGIKSNGKPLLPLQEDSWTIGKLTGTSGLTIAQDIANQYFQINGDPVIPYPKNPDPSLELRDKKGEDKISINGLSNAFITGFDNYQYNEAEQTVTADIAMQFNYWTNNPKGLQPGQEITPLSIDTPFILTQDLCKAETMNSPTCIDGNADPIHIEGFGTFSADISQLNFVASIAINVEPDRSGLDMKVTKLTLITTGKGAPQFTNVKAKLSNQTDFQAIISQLITTFMSSPDASEAVFKQMGDSLNSPHNINALSDTLKDQVADFLDSRLGPVTGKLPSDDGQKDANLVDQYLFDRIRFSINNPDSDWYVQTMLKNYKNPPLDPFKPEDIDVGDFEIFDGFKLTDVKLSNIVIDGFPNATAPADKMILAPPVVDMAVLLGSLGSGTKATADFSADFPGGKLKLKIKVEVKGVTLTSVVEASGEDVSRLVITMDSIKYSIPKVSDMKISISDQSGLGPAVEKVLNTKPVQDKIVKAIDKETKSHLDDISKEVTSIVKSILNEQIGG